MEFPKLSTIKTWFIDCDGVVLDSNAIKTSALYELALPFGKAIADRFREYHVQNGGGSRKSKLSYLWNELAQKPDFDSEYPLLCEKLSKLLETKLIHCPETDGLRSFLDLTGRAAKRLIISGGDESELKSIFRKRGLLESFYGIHGSPRSKGEILNQIVPNLKPHDRPMLFVGDSRLDSEVAAAHGIPFIFMYGYTEFHHWEEFFEGKDVWIVKNWVDLVERCGF